MTSGYCCSRCGNFRRKLRSACPSCGFDVAQSLEAQAKSLILSTKYEVNDTSRTSPVEQLAAAAAQIRAGSYTFDPSEVSEVATYLAVSRRATKGCALLVVDIVAAALTLGAAGALLRYAGRNGQPIRNPWLMLGPLLLCGGYLLYRRNRSPLLRRPSELRKDRALQWLHDRRATETTPASGNLPTDTPLPEEIAELFSTYTSVRVRFQNFELASRYLTEHAPEGNIVIGRFQGRPVLADSQSGLLREEHGALPEELTVYQMIDFLCRHEFPHLRSEVA